MNNSELIPSAMAELALRLVNLRNILRKLNVDLNMLKGEVRIRQWGFKVRKVDLPAGLI